MVVFVEVHLHVEIPAGDIVEVLSCRIEGGIEVVEEIVADSRLCVLFKRIEEDLAVAIVLCEGVGDPLAVRGPGIVVHLPEELVVLGLV